MALPGWCPLGQHRAVTSQDEKNPLEKAVDLFVFAPIGLASMARQMLPGLIEQGRQRVANQVNTAKVVGQFAVQQGQHEVNRLAGQVKEQAGDLVGRADGPASQPAAPAAERSAPEVEPKVEAAPEEPAGPPAPAVDALAIPNYDSLSASQVVPRLGGLESEELEAVRRYEDAKRGRKTILNKIAQIQAQG